MIGVALTAGMWIHAVLNALVTWERQGRPKHLRKRRPRPRHKPHNALWGELRIFPVVLVTVAIWIALWWVLDLPYDSLHRPPALRIWA